ncbi:hypothetical protein B0T25DRAFT_30204 [Lasiosphaeria hispida]|uniref:Uncharacterized protein n=1 Tax=Lasiosphaeria hispida TaxID=260671 RepID=A0AAJ0MJS5_9PEZI|nr:hypothetical protein B0T25DRAFT_30204 [Lasiosphaeria hispida]
MICQKQPLPSVTTRLPRVLGLHANFSVVDCVSESTHLQPALCVPFSCDPPGLVICSRVVDNSVLFRGFRRNKQTASLLQSPRSHNTHGEEGVSSKSPFYLLLLFTNIANDRLEQNFATFRRPIAGQAHAHLRRLRSSPHTLRCTSVVQSLHPHSSQSCQSGGRQVVCLTSVQVAARTTTENSNLDSNFGSRSKLPSASSPGSYSEL